MRSVLMALAAAGLAVAGAQSASAAGMAGTPAYTWTGCYIGGNAGAAWSHTKVTDEVDGYEIATLTASAAAGGAQIGCNYQFAPQWVVGVQGMWNATGLKSEAEGGVLDPLVLHGSIPWVATATARLGFLPMPDVMIYAKGGAAWNHTDTSLTYLGDEVSATSFDQTGWTVGGGIEWKMAPQWSLFAEYNYLGFSPTEVTFPSDDIGVVNQNAQLLLVGINLHFGTP